MRYLALVCAVLMLAPVASARERAPGAPGDKATWAQAEKLGFGTSATRASRVWFTLRETGLTEVFYPDVTHPSARELTFMVDGRRVTTGTVANDALTYTHTTETDAWRLIRTYVSDPERATVLVKVRFESRDGADHDVEVAFDPQLYGDGDDDVGWTRGHALLAHDAHIASALVARPSLTRTSSGYKGREEGTLLEHTYDALRPGNVVQQAHTRLTGRGDDRDLVLALGFGTRGSEALGAAQASLNAGWDGVAAAYRQGWLDYRNTLFPIPAAGLPVQAAYETSVLLLKAFEDKDDQGAFIASPSAEHDVVRARDLYHVATGLIAAGDKAAANRALDQLLDGRMAGDGLTLVLAQQLASTDWTRVRRIADSLVGAKSGSAERIAGLICAADLARRKGAVARARKYERVADAWQRSVAVTEDNVLELVRLGVKRADDPAVLSVLRTNRKGQFQPARVGARGEYELLAGRPATTQLGTLGSAVNDGNMLGERNPGATPFAWSHAQLVRLAWSIETRTPVELPAVVAARYTSAAS
ncbi:hypothetical protein OJ997_23170 [Solirubrobacter phytolaccae]|uniref:Glucodextranase N-terminal domain-containing protein n=1 Tax=Solirubrobacter phytolaccae TaxID=1404360 RepID=A0A9X3SB43_9ACTN|nr:hypothetical protein [Solirubrobacter phytolaccae]MDA0183231.1 hypothetical protein [Solirubrobacter phytolaccae]